MSPFSSQTTKPHAVLNGSPGTFSAWWWVVLVCGPLLSEFLIILQTGQLKIYFWLCRQALPGMLVAWPISIPLLIWLYLGWRRCLERNEMSSLRLLWLVPLIVLPLSMLFWGTLFYNPEKYSGNYDRSHIAFLQFIFHAMFLNAILAIGFNYGRNSFVIPFCLLALLLNFFCAFIAGSAVSGEWL